MPGNEQTSGNGQTPDDEQTPGNQTPREPMEYSVTYNLTGMTAVTAPPTVTHGSPLGIRLEFMENYVEPVALNISVDGQSLSLGSGYGIISRNPLIINIDADAVTGNIVVTATATQAPERSHNANLATIRYSDPGTFIGTSLTQEQIEQAAAGGVSLTLSHRTLENSILWLNYTTEDSNASARDNLARVVDGKATAIITVTAEDGTTTKQYTLNFTVDPVHNWGTPTWEWAEDYSSAKATFVCRIDSYHVEEVDATISSEVVNPGCEGEQEVVHTASVTFNGVNYTDQRTETGAQTGHIWGEPTWTWSANGASASVVFACQNDPSHMQSPAVEVVCVSMTPATCTQEGEATYSATATFNGQTYTDTNVVTLPPAHNYEASVTNPTCTKGGYTTYTCLECGVSYTANETAARGHYYGEWSFNGDDTHSAACVRSGCGHVGTTACEQFDWQLFMWDMEDEPAYAFAFCPVCGEVDDGARLLLAEARAEALTERLPRGEIVLRMGELENGEAVMSVGFEYSGKLTQPTGVVEVAVPAALLEGYTALLLDADGTETELAVTVEEDELSFTLDFTPADEENEEEAPVPIRVIRLVPVEE